ncbi:MAG: hypothetical protein DWQ07_21380 [Chloroflexi bacterium]|nr:MAG: hypothetical protein DWQ07_21380 [Chloroflexota bacterium]MBL1196626.1 hypothetical protein [Chloroflexota bacterium]NOH13919.1 hypothetical protein [Chloroflexota bacterium]
MKTFSLKNRATLALTILAIGALACGTLTVTSSGDVPPSAPGQGPLGPEDGVRTSPPTWTPAPTNTLQPSPTRNPIEEATNTPTIPAFLTTSLAQTTSIVITAVPVDDDLTGWQLVDSGTAEIWVPGDYEVINFSEGFDEAFAELFTGLTEIFVEEISEFSEEEGGEPIPTVDSSELEEFFNFELVIAADQSSFTGMFLVAEDVDPATDLESEINRTITQQNEPGFRLSDRAIVELPNYNAGRLLYDGVDASSGLPVKQVAYLILQGDRLWTIIYTTSSDFFGDLYVSTFEKSIGTFEVK